MELYIKNNHTGDVHHYGDLLGDALIIVNGGIVYHNLIDDGSTKLGGKYSFCTSDGADPGSVPGNDGWFDVTDEHPGRKYKRDAKESMPDILKLTQVGMHYWEQNDPAVYLDKRAVVGIKNGAGAGHTQVLLEGGASVDVLEGIDTIAGMLGWL